MPVKKQKKMSRVWFVLFLLLLTVNFVLFIRMQLLGNNVALFNPKGLIANQQFDLIVYATIVMLVIAVPTLFLLYFVAWKYRETNTKAAYKPETRHGKWFNFSIWAIPAVFMLILTAMMIPATHKLDPRKTIAADAKPLKIQVISLRWKWLFLYPEQQVASVNFVQLPVNTPVTFEMTADEAPMSSFWIPNLGGQLYTMTSHVNRLNLIAETPGDYPGSSAEINGVGFSGMKFTARAGSGSDFDNWVKQAKQSADVLTAARYGSLIRPSERDPVTLFSSYENDIYDKVILKYAGTGGGHTSHNE